MFARAVCRALLLTLSLSVPLVANASWWNDDWNFRKQFTLDTTAAGAGLAAGVKDAPVLLRLHIGNFGYFADTQPDGADLRFIAGDDTTPLPFYIESYDPAVEMAYIWVKVPELAANTSASLYMYYGNPEATAGSDPAAIQDVSQILSYAFAGEPFRDLTEYANHPAQATATLSPGAVIGAGAAFAGAESIQVPSSAVLRYLPDFGLTFSTWIRAEQPQDGAVLVESVDPSDALISLRLDGLLPRLSLGNGTEVTDIVASKELQPATWHQLAFTLSAATSRIYLDGEVVAEGAGLAAEVGGAFFIGADSLGTLHLNGAQLDQLMFANTARSADYLRLLFANEGQNDLLVRYGEDGQREAGEEPSYLIITLNNVTLDGWIVILLCALMSVVSWVIMVSKVIALRRVRKENAQFLQDFRKQQNISDLDRAETDEEAELHNHPLLEAMGEHDHYQAATLYHLYHTGISEAGKRLKGSVVGASRSRLISRQGMDAIKAAIDSTSVRETQKLNSQMVLLTIAIAGGPFLGLLGTVVGVMITFAAIAASGDVNVNSIAPGIAAALAATVAGLVVAIPALFGYNYLASQIKEIVADDRVFIDEFTTRLAEAYS